MDCVFASETADQTTVDALVRYIEHRSAVCAKVLNRDGDIVAVNRRGLELLKADIKDVCNKLWASFWEGDARTAAEDVVAKAFNGEAGQFVGEFYGTGERTVWEVEAFPLERDATGAVKTVLIISVNITAAERAAGPDLSVQALSALSETLHAISNLSNVSSSSARLLSRGQDDPQVQQIASGLEEAAQRATAAVEELRKLSESLKH